MGGVLISTRELALKLIKGLSKRKTAIFTINTRGHDNLTILTRAVGGKRLRIRGGTEVEKFEEAALDIEGAIRCLRETGFKRFVLSGHSSGSQKITYYQLKKNDKSVVGLALIAPGDDYNQWKGRILRKKFSETVKEAKRLVAKGKGYMLDFTEDATPNRFLSVADLRNIEARLFNFDGELKEFSKIKTPLLVIFGSKDEGAMKPVEQYLKILKKKSNSKVFESHIIKGATHRFSGHQDEVAAIISKFVSKLD